MAQAVIHVNDIGKKFRIGHHNRNTASLAETLNQMVKLPAQWLKRRNSDEEIEQSGMFWALRHITFQVNQGEVLGIIGSNGSGKSTLLKILSRITRPSEGDFELWGRTGSLLEVGTGFHPELTGRENVFLNGSILGMRRAEINTKYDEIVAFSGVEKFIDTPVKHYSSGMYVRLAFSVAAHLDTDILLLDEVLSVGDLAFKAKSEEKMKNVAKDGRTVILVSHDMDSIMELCGRVILMNKGSILMVEKPEIAVAAYRELNRVAPVPSPS